MVATVSEPEFSVIFNELRDTSVGGALRADSATSFASTNAIDATPPPFTVSAAVPTCSAKICVFESVFLRAESVPSDNFTPRTFASPIAVWMLAFTFKTEVTTSAEIESNVALIEASSVPASTNVFSLPLAAVLIAPRSVASVRSIRAVVPDDAFACTTSTTESNA